MSLILGNYFLTTGILQLNIEAATLSCSERGCTFLLTDLNIFKDSEKYFGE